MSPENHIGIIATAIGAFMSAIGHSEWQRRRVNRLEEKVNAGCPTLDKVDTRLTRVEQKVPSGNVTCASHEDVSVLFEKVDKSTEEVSDLNQVVTEFITIVKERLPKR